MPTSDGDPWGIKAVVSCTVDDALLQSMGDQNSKACSILRLMRIMAQVNEYVLSSSVSLS